VVEVDADHLERAQLFLLSRFGKSQKRLIIVDSINRNGSRANARCSVRILPLKDRFRLI
jgi:hypothetical protein